MAPMHLYHESISDLAGYVDKQGGVITMPLEVIRDAYGNKKLGVYVRQGISKALQSHGLGHNPAELPTYQEEMVMVYRRGSPVGDIIEAVMQPSSQGDEILREVAASEDAKLLQRVRELVCR